MSDNILTVGLDLGNDAFKVVGPTKKEFFVLNLISPWYERRVITEDTRFPLNLLEVEIRSKAENLGKFFVGGMAYNYNRGIIKEKTVADRHIGKSEDNGTFIISLTSLALSLIRPNTKIIKEKIVVGTMLPAEEYFKNGKENVRILEDKLTGVHRIKFLNPIFKGIEVEFEVVGVTVEPEGLCALNAILYDDNGELLDEYRDNYAENTILGFDIGALTTDVTVMQNFELRTFFGIDKGTIDPLNRIVDFIKTEHKVSLPRHKVDNAITKNEKLLVYGKEIPNFKEMSSEMIQFEGRQLVDEFSAKAAAAGIKLPDIGLMILSGGGSLLFKESIEQHLSRIPMIFSENAIMLNAVGAWKNANKYKNQMSEMNTSDFAAFTL
jgi:plasmid segregation protein ParM